MPSHLLAFFAARPPLERLPQRGRRERKPYDGIAAFTHLFEKETPEPPPPFVSPQQRRLELKAAREKEHRETQNRRRALYDPHVDPEKQKTAEPRHTLFVGRLSYETTEKKLLKTFEPFGQIRDIRVVCDAQSKPRGYAFIEFKTEEGMWNAYKNANQKQIDNRTVIVDTEKARLVPGWYPRRLGGGEGPPRKGVAPLRTRLVHQDVTTRFSRGGGPRGGRGGGSFRGGPPRLSNRYSSSSSSRPPPRRGPSGPYEGGPGGGRYDRERSSAPYRGARNDARTDARNDYSTRFYH